MLTENVEESFWTYRKGRYSTLKRLMEALGASESTVRRPFFY